MAYKILLAEDDPNLGQLLKDYLELKGYFPTLAVNGEMAIELFLTKPFDICIFDVMMPKKDGFSLAKEIRQKNKSIPIIFLTAKGQKEDTLQGFKVGGDDYITKPFLMEELLVRLEAIMRRVSGKSFQTEEELFQIGIFVFDSKIQNLKADDMVVKLTSKENELLKLLCQNKNQVVSRSFALKLIWGDDSYFNARSMDVYLTKLRKYLKSDPAIQIINMHGEGFKLIEGVG